MEYWWFAGIVLAIVFFAIVRQRDQGYYLTQYKPRLTKDELEQQVRLLTQQGQKIQAIKLLRSNSPLGLKEAKDKVEDLMRGEQLIVDRQSNHAQITLSEPIRLLLKQGKKLAAIKELRRQTGMGLKEAMDILNQIEETI
jgi:ribosomal protein L7/L12